MRKMLFASLVAAMFATISMLSVTAVSAQDDESEPLQCAVTLVFDVSLPPADWHWEGPISGDITGTMYLYEKSDNFVVGNTEHFFEDFVIKTSSGDVIKGIDQGIWTMKTLKFRDHGSVTEASGASEFLVGWNVHTMGVTTAFPPIPPSTSVIGTGTLTLVPP